MKRHTAIWLVTCAAAAASAQAADGDDNITPDRPNVAESSNVVGAGRVQIETGLYQERDRSGGLRERALTTPTLLRVGVHDDWELRFETDGRTVQRLQPDGGTASTTRGWADLSLGVKWHMQDGDGGRPSVGWLLHADLDSASAPFRGQGVRPSLRVSAEWALPGGLSLGVMPGVALDRDDQGRRYGYGVLAVALGQSFSERWSGFVEVAAPRIVSSRRGGSLLSVDVGGAYLISRNLQVDAIVQVGANRNTPDLGGGFGISTRF